MPSSHLPPLSTLPLTPPYTFFFYPPLTQMPKHLRREISVHIIQSRDHILNTYSEKISQYAEAKFARDEIDTILNARVRSVSDKSVVYTTKDENGTPVEHELQSGFTLWSTGIGELPVSGPVVWFLGEG